MAYTGTIVKKDVFGSTRVHVLDVTSDATSGAVDTGLAVVLGASMCPKSMNTGGPIVRVNKNSGATALNGSVMFSATTSGDNFFLVVYGV